MPGNTNINRVHDLAYDIAEQNAYMRSVIAQSLEILRKPIPDTFLGRATHDQFPNESDGELVEV